jgi:hypothetical protein
MMIHDTAAAVPTAATADSRGSSGCEEEAQETIDQETFFALMGRSAWY